MTTGVMIRELEDKLSFEAPRVPRGLRQSLCEVGHSHSCGEGVLRFV